MAIKRVLLFLFLSLHLTVIAYDTAALTPSRNPDPEHYPLLRFAEYTESNPPEKGKFGSIYLNRFISNSTYLIIVEESLVEPLYNEIEQLYEDYENEGYSPIVISYNGNSASQLREEIIAYYLDSDIIGLLLVGDLPSAWFELFEDWNHNDTQDSDEDFVDFPCDLYFADVDGIWDDLDNNGIYDSHTGDMQPELKIGRIKADNLTLTDQDEIELLRSYFSRNHLYRTNQLQPSDAALLYLDDDWQATADTNTGHLRILYNTITVVNDPNSTTAYNYLNQHLNQPYEFIQLHAHSSSQNHSFFQNGHTETDVVSNLQIAELNPQCMFYNLFCCSAGNFEADNCLASTYLLSNDYGLGVITSSKSGGMLFFNHMYSHLAQDESFGSAFKSWWIRHVDTGEEVQFKRTWFYGMMLMGDPTLKLYRESATTWHVSVDAETEGDGTSSSPFRSIQTAIDLSTDGDEILVEDGTYHESVDYSGKSVKIRSVNGNKHCIIDGENIRNCIILENDEPETCLLDGFTIINGKGGGTPATSGGAIRCFNDANPILKNLIVTENYNCNEAVYFGDSNPTLINCEIVSNSTRGIYMEYISSPTFRNCKISYNSEGGIHSNQSPFEMSNCEIAYNGSNTLGGGIYIFDTSCFLEAVSIHHNQSSQGGGIYLKQGEVTFSDENRCSIYSNTANVGLDLYQVACTEIWDVIIDTFSVIAPGNRYANPIYAYNFDILNAAINLVNKDLYVSPEGDDSNDGLTMFTAFRSISQAVNVISANIDNPRTIFLAEGIYNQDITGESFPIILPSYISIISEGETCIEGNTETSIFTANEVENTKLSGMILRNCKTAVTAYESTLELKDMDISESRKAISAHNSDISLLQSKLHHNSGDIGSAISAKYNSKIEITDCSIYNNDSISKGAVNIENSELNIQGGTIKNNISENLGGGIFCSNSMLNFKHDNPPNIYSNSAPLGRDIFLEDLPEPCIAYLDTFTVMNPNNIFAYPVEDIQFEINHSINHEIDYNNVELVINPHIIGNFPNPFYTSGGSSNSGTKIKFQLRRQITLASETDTADTADSRSSDETVEAVDVRVEIYNIKGQKIKSFSITSPEVPRSSSNNELILNWNGRDDNNKAVSSGIYLYKLVIGNKSVDVKKMMVLK